MASSLTSGPSAETLDVEELATQAWSGSIRVPHFQRDFRWAWVDVRRLFDSIVKGYPLGSLLLWVRDAPAATVHLGALTVDAPSRERAYWVVDGQQRLTSLANALHPVAGLDTRFALAYDLRRDEFVKPSKFADPFIIPLPILFDLQKIIIWFAENPVASEYLENATRITKTIRQYEIPVYVVDTDNPKVLQDIFDRMNNYGKRLTRAEVFTALNAPEEPPYSDTKTLEGISSAVDERFDFGQIDNNTTLACILARRGPEVRRDVRKEFEGTGDEGLQSAYNAGEVAIGRAIKFLQNEAGVPHYRFVAYRYLLVVLSRLFAFYPELHPRNVSLLRRWYWRAAMLGPEQFKGGTPNAAKILCSRIVQDDEHLSIQQLLDAVDTTASPRMPDITYFATKNASTKVYLCALWALQPRNVLTGEPFTFADLAQALEGSSTAQPAIRSILPRSLTPVEMRPWAANRVLMPVLDIDPQELWAELSQQSLSLDHEVWEEVLTSHGFREPFPIAVQEGAERQFLQQRQNSLETILHDFLGRMAEWGLDDAPPLSSLDLG